MNKQKEKDNEYSPDVREYVNRLFSENNRQFACHAKNPAEIEKWQAKARPEYKKLLGIPVIEMMNVDHTPKTLLSDEIEDMGRYTRQRGSIEIEHHVKIHFWMLKPKEGTKFPLAIMPHGHGTADSYLGIAQNEKEKIKIFEEDRDIAVQAVTRGYLVIVPSTRGIGQNPTSFGMPDIAGRHHGVDCVCHNWHVIAAGRSMIGERVWDLMKIIDWALECLDVDPKRILMMGNSGGGMATLHTSAADVRIQTAVSCGCFNNYISFEGALRHCPCNVAPGLLSFGEFWDVAGLTAPRYLLTVNGRYDPGHPEEEVTNAVGKLGQIYRAAAVPGHYEHRFGNGGHRFFKDLMWPWIDGVMKKPV